MNLDKLAPKIAEQDKAAFESLYESMRRLVFAVVLSILKNRAIAEEVMQDTFVAVWQKSGDFRGRGYKTWILKVARNKALNALRRSKKETPTDFSENESLLGWYTIEDDTGLALKTALKTLSDDERQIVLMRNAGIKAKEIAEVLGLPRGTVSWKYTEALKKLKNLLEDAP